MVTLTDLFYEDAPWKLEAACRDTDYTIFFPEGKGDWQNKTQQAYRTCMVCVVQAECLEYALDWPQANDYGIYAGTNAKRRRKLRRERAAA